MARETTSGNRHYFTRIAYNSSGWHHPTGDARALESPGTMNSDVGFGGEDWLFRSEWKIDGWRYAFLQGVNKSHARLLKEGRPFDLTLYAIQPGKQWRFVATVREVECLDDEQARAARREFKRRGWHRQMQAEVKKAHGDVATFRRVIDDLYLLNVRYRIKNLAFFPPETYINTDDPIRDWRRYMLYEAAKRKVATGETRITGRAGSSELPEVQQIQRCTVEAVEYTPEHMSIQAQLMKELKSEYPQARITREQDFIDVRVETTKELNLFEIKSDLSPRTVIREALGQILEYAFHPRNSHTLPVRLVIVGRNELTEDDSVYLSTLRRKFGLPVEYRVVSI